MKTQLLTALIATFFAVTGFSQTQFWVDNFEDVGMPSSGTRTPSVQNSFGSPASRYFFRTDASSSSILLQNGSYIGMQGSKCWAAEDIDAALTGTNFGQSNHQNITWTSINITGKTGLIFKGLFAAENTGSNWEGSSVPPADYMIVEYRIDGGAWTNAVRFFSNSGLNGQLALETTGDSLAEGALLTKTFTEYTWNIIGTGSNLELRFKCSSNGATTEEFAIDDFRLFETPTCTAPTITANPPNRAICNGTNTTFSASASGATAYQWQFDPTGAGTYTNLTNGAPYSGVTTTTLTITGATAGMTGFRYRLVAINGVASCFTNSNYGTLSVSNITTSGSQTNISCFGGSNGNAAVSATGGIGGYTYSWSPAGGTSPIATGLSAGTYVVTVTDAIGCTANRSYTITQPPVLNGSTVITNLSCNGGTNGSINLTPSGGTPGYTFNWGGGITTEDRIGLAAGTYTVIITDANSCTATVSATLTQPATPVSGTTVVTNVSCFGGTNGSINLTPSGGSGSGYTFNWGGGITTEDRTGLAAGTYTVFITDGGGCTGTVNATVTQPTTPVSGSTVITNVSCFGGTNGSINLTPSGGTGSGYTFNWGGGVTTEDRTGLAAGTYTVIITDANGCTGTVVRTVTQPTSPVSGTTVVTNVSCFGGSNGAINLTPSGGTGSGYTFNWLPSGPTTEDRTGLTAGTYNVQITDANGCTGTVSATVTQPTTPVSGTTVVTNVSCFGGSNGSINLTPSGGAGGFTYFWLPSGPTTEDRTGLTAGTYNVQITDANGCTGTVSATVTQATTPVSGTTVVTNVSCFGGSNGAINLTPSGGTGSGYTFNWGGGITTEDRTGLTAGTYTVIITDANSCTATVSATLTQPATPVSGTRVITNVSCFGGTNGTINLTPTGGTGSGYTFNWGGGITTEDRTGLAAGTYTVIITDMNGCTGTVSSTVTQPTSPVSGTTVVTNVSCFGGTNGSINLTPSGGTGSGYTFNWGGGITTEDRTGLAAGTYTVIITDFNGCTGTVNATVTQPASPVSGTTVVTNVACFGGSNGAINLTPSGGTGSGTYTFNWGGGITTEDRTGLAAGTYTVIITDLNGCTGTVSATVTQPVSTIGGTTVVTNVSCFGGSNGTIDLTPSGGLPGYTYNWGSGITTQDRTGLTAGTYNVIIADANGCTGTVSATVTQPSSPVSGTTVVTNVACFGGSNGTINLTPSGGTGSGYTFNWGSGITTEDRTGLTAGTYTVVITDMNGCTGTVSATVTQPTFPVGGSTVVTNVSCFGGSNGAINLTPSGGTGLGYTFNWGSGITTEDRTGLTAGTYAVTITDLNGCTGTASATITQPPVLSAAVTSQTDVSCNGGSNGTLTVTATGGTGTPTYSWSPAGGTAATASGLAAGTYTVTVTDANSCSITASATVTQPSAILLTGTSTDVSCNGGSNGTATVVANGGTGTFLYSWSPSGGNASTATGLSAGTYTVTAIDQNGCTATQSVSVSQPSPIVINGTQTSPSCFGTLDGEIAATVTGGTGTYTYSWSPAGGNGATASNLGDGTYTVTVTDQNGCTQTGSWTITEPAEIMITSLQTDVSCNGDSTGMATVSATAGVGNYNYSWSPYGGTDAMAMDLAAGTFTVTATDDNGCSSIHTVVITEPTAIVLSSSATEVTCNGGNDGTATVSATGGTGTAYAYSWSPEGGTNAGASGLTAGMYTVTVTDESGCAATEVVMVGEAAAIVMNQSFTVCAGESVTVGQNTYDQSGTYTDVFQTANGCDSTVTTVLVVNAAVNASTTTSGITITASASGADYQWINCATGTAIAGATSQAFTASANGSYAVVVTVNGCSDTSACTNITTVGLSELTAKWNATLYPNPSNGSVTIDWGVSLDEVAIAITDVAGKVIYISTVEQAASHKLDLDQPTGVYYVRVSSATGQVVLKMVKN